MGEPPVRRALLLLAAAWPDSSPDSLAILPVGRRDAALLALRGAVFGPRLESVATCPSCSEQAELSFDVGDIRAEPAFTVEGELSLSAGDYEVRFRLPDSGDTLVAHDETVLLQRCVLGAARVGEPVTAEDLPAPVIEALAARMAELDPQADVTLSVKCPACGHTWEAVFDIVSYLYREARRLGDTAALRSSRARVGIRLERRRNPGAQPVAAPVLSGGDWPMSDYLSRLAARSRPAGLAQNAGGERDFVRPRLVSLFEPVAPAAGPMPTVRSDGVAFATGEELAEELSWDEAPTPAPAPRPTAAGATLPARRAHVEGVAAGNDVAPQVPYRGADERGTGALRNPPARLRPGG